jgi:hypothetical protein
MALSEKEKYHGAVLYQVVTNPDFSLKLIKRDKKEHGYGIYEVDSDSGNHILFIKCSSRVRGKKRLYCNFTFSSTDIGQIQKYLNNNSQELLVCLVCHDKHICALTQSDVEKLNLTPTNGSCRVSVYWEKNSELTVKSKHSELSHKVPRKKLQALFK